MEMISSNKLYAPLIDNKDAGDKKNEVNLLYYFNKFKNLQLITWIKNYSNHQATEETSNNLVKKEPRRQSIKIPFHDQRLKSGIFSQNEV